MSKRERQMIEKYWEEIGGTLILEYPIVSKNPTRARRLVDAIILPSHKKQKAKAHYIDIRDLKGEKIIVVQAKASRLGMYLMGQAYFSAEILKRYKPKTIRSVALCNKDDSELRPIFEKHKDMEVVVRNAV